MWLYIIMLSIPIYRMVSHLKTSLILTFSSVSTYITHIQRLLGSWKVHSSRVAFNPVSYMMYMQCIGGQVPQATSEITKKWNTCITIGHCGRYVSGNIISSYYLQSLCMFHLKKISTVSLPLLSSSNTSNSICRIKCPFQDIGIPTNPVLLSLTCSTLGS